jgi:hypothetical protein
VNDEKNEKVLITENLCSFAECSGQLMEYGNEPSSIDFDYLLSVLLPLRSDLCVTELNAILEEFFAFRFSFFSSYYFRSLL